MINVMHEGWKFWRAYCINCQMRTEPIKSKQEAIDRWNTRQSDHPQSPNGLWTKHSYTIQREPGGYGSSMVRTITAPDGEVVLVDAGYDGEVKWIRENLEAEND